MTLILVDTEKLRGMITISELDGERVGQKGKTIVFATLELQDQQQVSTESLNDPKYKIREEVIRNLEDNVIEQLRNLQ
jgi:hypothetical protein